MASEIKKLRTIRRIMSRVRPRTKATTAEPQAQNAPAVVTAANPRPSLIRGTPPDERSMLKVPNR
jgi:hypothetical protein